MPAISVTKKNSISIYYDALTEEGKRVSRSQSFDLMPLDATNQDFLDLGNALGGILEYSPKEIQKNNVTVIMEG